MTRRAPISKEQFDACWARLSAGTSTLKEEAARFGYDSVYGLYFVLRRRKPKLAVRRVLRQANRQARARKRAAKVTAVSLIPVSTVQHSDPAISPTQSIPVSADRVLLAQRIARHISLRTARVEGRAVHAALHIGGTVLLPVAAIGDLCVLLRKLARTRDPSQGR